MSQTVVVPAEADAARRRLTEALRRVNQDYLIFGEADRDLLHRLDCARRQLRHLGLA